MGKVEGVTVQSLEGKNVSASDIRDKVSLMVVREATVVFGEDLTRSVEDQLIEVGTPNYKEARKTEIIRDGYHALRLFYAPTAAGIMRSMGWSEGDPQTELFTSGIYTRSLALREARGEDIALDHRATVLARTSFAEEHDTDITKPDLLVALYDIKGDARSRLIIQLAKPKTHERAFDRLRTH